MMVKPAISTLLKRVDSRYTLVTMAAKRARMIGAEDGQKNEKGEKNESPKNSKKIRKPVSEAVEEIAQGRVGYIRSETIQKAKEWEAEKAAAILAMNDSQPEEFADINREVNDVISEPVFGESIFKSSSMFNDED